MVRRPENEPRSRADLMRKARRTATHWALVSKASRQQDASSKPRQGESTDAREEAGAG